MRSAHLQEPLFDKNKDYVMSETAMFADDTIVKLLALSNGQTKTAQLSIYDRNGRASSAPRHACKQAMTEIWHYIDEFKTRLDATQPATLQAQSNMN